MNAEFDDNRP